MRKHKGPILPLNLSRPSLSLRHQKQIVFIILGCKVNERSLSDSQGVLPPLHLSKQLIRSEITHQKQHGWHAGWGQETNRFLPPLLGSVGLTAAPAAVIVLLNGRKRPIRPKKQSVESRRDKPGGGGRSKGSKACLAFTFFLFLWVAVALIFDEARARRASGASHALQAALHQLAQLAARPGRHHLTVLALHLDERDERKLWLTLLQTPKWRVIERAHLVDQEVLPLPSQVVGQVAVFAELHNHH